MNIWIRVLALSALSIAPAGVEEWGSRGGEQQPLELRSQGVTARTDVGFLQMFEEWAVRRDGAGSALDVLRRQQRVPQLARLIVLPDQGWMLLFRRATDGHCQLQRHAPAGPPMWRSATVTGVCATLSLYADASGLDLALSRRPCRIVNGLRRACRVFDEA
jgi:hypothetical protein